MKRTGLKDIENLSTSNVQYVLLPLGIRVASVEEITDEEVVKMRLEK
jgi:hypothetical protein